MISPSSGQLMSKLSNSFLSSPTHTIFDPHTLCITQLTTTTSPFDGSNHTCFPTQSILKCGPAFSQSYTHTSYENITMANSLCVAQYSLVAHTHWFSYNKMRRHVACHSHQTPRSVKHLSWWPLATTTIMHAVIGYMLFEPNILTITLTPKYYIPNNMIAHN